MKKLHGLPAQLDSYLRSAGRWISKGHLTAEVEWKHQRGKHTGARYLPETVGRALRHLEEASNIAVRESGISVEYKWLPFELRGRYIPSSARPDSEKDTLFREQRMEDLQDSLI